jgi:seryl-tRNA synthetase
MHDIKFIRENTHIFKAGLQKRGLEADTIINSLVEIDEKRKTAISQAQELQTRRNAVSKDVGMAKSKGNHDIADKLIAEISHIKEDTQNLETSVSELEFELSKQLSIIPNIPYEDVPFGKDEHDNVEIRTFGTPKDLPFAKDHFDIQSITPLMDFETATKVSGARFVFSKGQLAKLERAIANFMLDVHTTEFGYTEINPPVIVNSSSLYGTGQLPKFTEDLFKLEGTDYWLIPTAEVSLTNMVSDALLIEEELPLRLTALTPCFRSEAGSGGRDTRGMIRQHQFSKVELVSITTPDQSKNEHERMVSCAESILQRLELPYRTMLLCSGDMGFSSNKTYDIEVWLPGQKRYREISSCSNCDAFQARRMNARYRPIIKDTKKTDFVHTLNGSGLAVGRTLIAVLENYQQEDGSVIIPNVLKPYMKGSHNI